MRCPVCWPCFVFFNVNGMRGRNGFGEGREEGLKSLAVQFRFTFVGQGEETTVEIRSGEDI